MKIERYTIPGAYSLATGERLPSETFEREAIGHAPIVRRRTSTFPSRMALYWDLTPWGAGFMRASNAGQGACIINHREGIMFNMQTGHVYRDSRLANKGE